MSFLKPKAAFDWIPLSNRAKMSNISNPVYISGHRQCQTRATVDDHQIHHVRQRRLPLRSTTASAFTSPSSSSSSFYQPVPHSFPPPFYPQPHAAVRFPIGPSILSPSDSHSDADFNCDFEDEDEEVNFSFVSSLFYRSDPDSRNAGLDLVFNPGDGSDDMDYDPEDLNLGVMGDESQGFDESDNELDLELGLGLGFGEDGGNRSTELQIQETDSLCVVSVDSDLESEAFGHGYTLEEEEEEEEEDDLVWPWFCWGDDDDDGDDGFTDRGGSSYADYDWEGADDNPEILSDEEEVPVHFDLGDDGFDDLEWDDMLIESGENLTGNPPAAKSVIENLPIVEFVNTSLLDDEILCAICKDEFSVEEKARQLPCCHYYHGDCIAPWLRIRNTCPVCRYELPTDDPDYEYRKRGWTTTEEDNAGGFAQDSEIGVDFDMLSRWIVTRIRTHLGQIC
ncbi:hypothetical protein Dimus_023294 [Dionaea muscipula]